MYKMNNIYIDTFYHMQVLIIFKVFFEVSFYLLRVFNCYRFFEVSLYLATLSSKGLNYMQLKH